MLSRLSIIFTALVATFFFPRRPPRRNRTRRSASTFICGATTTPLSNDGVRRGARWREYRRHLTAVAKCRQPAAGVPVAAALPFAVALGLADSWSTFLKRHGHAVPAWSHPLSSGDAHAAFPAFIATGGAGASGGYAGAGSGAAGGGASGAR